MIEIKKKLNLKPDFSPWANGIPNNKVVLIDIETTGFSPKTSYIYLIGCIFIENDSVQFLQWLCEEPSDEEAMLSALYEFIKDFEFAIHYNGTTFDFPFIEARMKLYKHDFEITKLPALDLYVVLKKYSKYLPLENLKLKTVEKALGYVRHDPFDGGQLINTYMEFVKSKDENQRKQLLCHNEEDLLGLYTSLDSSLWLKFFESLKSPSYNLNVSKKDSYLIIELKMEVPFEHHYDIGSYKISFIDNLVRISLPVYEGELRYYLKDYRNYYYLPAEDIVIHESVAQFVAPEHRQRATKQNGYIKKRGKFIPLLKNFDTSYKLFCESYNSQTKYVELTENLLTDNFYHQLVHSIFSGL